MLARAQPDVLGGEKPVADTASKTLLLSDPHYCAVGDKDVARLATANGAGGRPFLELYPVSRPDFDRTFLGGWRLQRFRIGQFHRNIS